LRVLLDTHAYLWWLADDPELSYEARDLLADPRTSAYVSAASVWEIAIKVKLGRLDLGAAGVMADVVEIAANDFTELPIHARHAAAAGALPRHHEDPFDRMLVAQAQSEHLILVTRDEKLSAYDVMIVAA
jgi:PIN domain nuclease of toxin-antitoxin system